jgi:hypothetical protein
MVNIWSAIVSVAVLALAVLAATSKLTDPFPLPLEPETMVIHATGLVATQVQPVGAVTETVPSPPAGPTD